MRFTPALAVLYLAIATQCVRAEDVGIIQGRVLNAANGDGLAGVAIQIKSGRAEPYTAMTDESGAYRISGVKYGGYGYTATRAGFEMLGSNGELRVQATEPVNFVIQMTEQTSIAGRVLDDAGEPAVHVCVQIHRGRECEVFTDTNGAFRFPDVRQGIYTLVAKPQQDDPERPKRADGLSLVATNFPSTIDREFAESIVVRPGARLPEFEIRLRTSRVYQLHGKVLDSAGKPVPQAKIRLLAPLPSLRERYVLDGERTLIGPARPEEELATSASADGSFEFTSVRPGNWLIQAELDPVNDPIERDIEPSGSEPVIVSSDVQDIVIHLADPFKLTYTEDWGTNVLPTRGNSSPLQLVPQEGQPPPPIPGEPKSFDLVVPGRYRIGPSYMPGFYVSSATLNGQEVLNEDVRIAPGDSMHVIYKPAGQVRGTIETKSNAIVILLPASMIQGEIRSMPVSAAGAFEIADVPPGDYVIAAFDRKDALFLETPSMIDRIVPKATALHVREGETSTVQLKLSPWP